jgi:hypothetical protein
VAYGLRRRGFLGGTLKKTYDSYMTQKEDILNPLTFDLINCKTANRRFGTVGSKRFLVLYQSLLKSRYPGPMESQCIFGRILFL